MNLHGTPLGGNSVRTSLQSKVTCTETTILLYDARLFIEIIITARITKTSLKNELTSRASVGLTPVTTAHWGVQITSSDELCLRRVDEAARERRAVAAVGAHGSELYHRLASWHEVAHRTKGLTKERAIQGRHHNHLGQSMGGNIVWVKHGNGPDSR